MLEAGPQLKWAVGGIAGLLLLVFLVRLQGGQRPASGSSIAAADQSILLSPAALCSNWFESKWARAEAFFVAAAARGRAGQAGYPFGAAQASWDGIEPVYVCEGDQRVGHPGDGGKWICGLSYTRAKKPCLIYSIGCNGEDSFEQEIYNMTGCDIVIFDPTLNAEKTAYIHESTPRYGGKFFPEGIGAGYKTFSELQKLSGTAGRYIDIYKIDVENSEWG